MIIINDSSWNKDLIIEYILYNGMKKNINVGVSIYNIKIISIEQDFL